MSSERKHAEQLDKELNEAIRENSRLKSLLDEQTRLLGNLTSRSDYISVENNFSNSVDYSPLPILISKNRGEITYANQAMIELFGFRTLDELKSVPYQQRHPEQYHTLLQERWDRLFDLEINEVSTELIESEVLRPNGEIIPVEVFCRKLDWGGEECIEVIYNDVTERKRFERELQNSNDLFRAVFNSTTEAISVLNTNDFTITRANSVFLKQCGYKSEQEVIGQTCYSMTHHRSQPCSLEGENCPLMETMLTGKHATTEHSHINENNEAVIVEISTAPLFNEEGHVTQVVHSSRDITERKKREAELLFQAEIISNMGEGVCSVRGSDGHIIYANKKFEAMLGYEPGELQDQDIAIINYGDEKTARQTAEKIRESIKQTGFWQGELRHIKKDGTPCWSQVSASEFQHPEYGFTSIAVLTDITRRKQAMDELNLRALLLDSASDSILVTGLNGEIIYANEAFCNSHGFIKEEIIGQNLRLLNTSIDEVTHETRIKNTLKKGHLKFETTYHHNDGSELDVEVQSQVLKSGDRTMILNIERDITERNQIEEALRESEQNFRLSLDDSPLGIIIYKDLGQTVYANRAALDIFGYRDLEAMQQGDFYSHHTPDNLEKIKNRWSKIKRKEFVSEQSEYTIISLDGETRYVEANIKNILWDGEEFLQIVYQDITERKHMEEQLRHSQVLASLGEMTAGIAHEIGNPLASIVLYSELLLKDNEIPQAARQDMKVIYNEAQRAGKLIKDLLAYSRKLKPKVQRVNMNVLIEEVVRLRQYHETVNNVSVHIRSVDGVVNIKGDRAQLTQVVLNLLLNAEESLKEYSGGNIWLNCELESGWFKLSIVDDGPGIPNEILEQIFMPFFTTKKVGEGTGLGLSTCYGIITAHGGTISAENNTQGGATFTIRLPLMDQAVQGNLQLEAE